MNNLLKACALATVILASSLAQAAPRVLNNCTTLTESGAYVVGRNLTATGDCFVIAADFVNLDLDGFTLTGNGTGAGISQLMPVFGTGRRGMVVRNGVVTNFQSGVSLEFSIGGRVEGMTVSGNTGNAIRLGDNGAAVRNTVMNNGGRGIEMALGGLAEGNQVRDNGVGILMGNGANVTGNTVGHNSGSGIVVSEGGLVSNNTSRNNTSNGIVADCPSLVIGNTSSLNLGQNLSVIGGACDPDSVLCCVRSINNMTL